MEPNLIFHSYCHSMQQCSVRESNPRFPYKSTVAGHWLTFDGSKCSVTYWTSTFILIMKVTKLMNNEIVGSLVWKKNMWRGTKNSTLQGLYMPGICAEQQHEWECIANSMPRPKCWGVVYYIKKMACGKYVHLHKRSISRAVFIMFFVRTLEPTLPRRNSRETLYISKSGALWICWTRRVVVA